MGVKERKALEKKMRRNQILDAARHLLFSSGITNISISKIAKASELGVGTIYFYYKNKEEIFFALQEEGLSLLYENILKISRKRINPEQKLRMVALAYYNFSGEQKNYFEIINYFLSSSTIFFQPGLKNKLDRSGDKILLVIQKIVDNGIRSQIFAETDSKKYAIMFWATLHGLIQAKKLENTLLENDSFDQLFDYSIQNLIKILIE